MDKAKNHLEADNEGLSNELKDMTRAFQESDKRRKNAEAALSEAQSRITEDTSRIQELSSQNDKMKVRERGCMLVREGGREGAGEREEKRRGREGEPG